jgi:hypothetical protein
MYSGNLGRCPDGHSSCGCHYGSLCCLGCPLPICVFEVKGTNVTARNSHLLRLFKEGMSVPEIAGRYELTKRSIHRALELARTT